MQILRLGECRFRVMCQERGHLERDPSIHSCGTLMNRTEQIGGAGEILQCDLEEQVLTGLARPHPLADTGVIAGTVLDRLIEDRRVRGQSRDGQLADITFERAARQQIACDVVEPQALARAMKWLGCLHVVSCGSHDRLLTFERRIYVRRSPGDEPGRSCISVVVYLMTLRRLC